HCQCRQNEPAYLQATTAPRYSRSMSGKDKTVPAYEKCSNTTEAESGKHLETAEVEDANPASKPVQSGTQTESTATNRLDLHIATSMQPTHLEMQPPSSHASSHQTAHPKELASTKSAQKTIVAPVRPARPEYAPKAQLVKSFYDDDFFCSHNNPYEAGSSHQCCSMLFGSLGFAS